MKSFLSFLLAISLIITSCKKPSDNPVTPGDDKKINTGDFVDVTNQSIGTGGGEINVNKPGDPLNGMKITIPPNSFSSTKIFKVSHAEIKSHSLGVKFNPITPLIQITCDENFADHPIQIEIPIKLPANHFASGFFYNENTQKLEIIPTIELTNNTITLKTQSLPANQKLGKSLDDTKTNIIISSIIESALEGSTVLSTGFEPGVDDWEFNNPGSYLKTTGFCAGQSMSTIYYYFEKRLKGEGPLYHKYDLIHDKSTSPPKLWQDNPKGIRLSSVMQNDLSNEGWPQLKTELVEHFTKPTLVWKLFIHGIIVTEVPQNIYVQMSTPPNYAHAMVVYKVNLTEKKLYIADPNYVGTLRTIAFKDGVLGPYTTKTKEGEPELVFDKIGFMGISALVKWSTLTQRFNQFEAGTIGNDVFPSYTFYVNNTSGEPLTDGKTVNTSQVKIVCKSTGCEGFISGTDKLQPIEIFDKDGNPIDRGDSHNSGIATVNLNEGENKIGIYIKGLKSDGSEHYIDFKWLTVNRSNISISISPNPLNSELNKENTLTAVLSGTLPSNIKYIWDFGDGTSNVTKINDNTVKHIYTKTGTFTIYLSVFDNSTDKKIGSATSVTSIVDILEIFKTKSVSIQLYGADRTFSNPSLWISELSISSYDYFIKTGNKITWSGLNFRHDINYQVGDMYDTVYYTGTIYGTVSANGSTLVSLYGEIHQRSWKYNSTYDQKIQIVNMPFNNVTVGSIQANASGTGVAGYVTTYDQRRRSWNSSTSSYEEVNVTSITYTNTSQLFIGFSKY